MIKRLIRKIIYKNSFLFNLYYTYLYKAKDDLSKFLNEYSKKKKGNIIFIQIGANDGQWNDPIYKFIRRDKWNGILIEPQKVIFERLTKTYRGYSGLSFENVAIDSISSFKDLYKISFTDSRWASGIASFLKEDVQKMIDAGYVERKCHEEGIIPPEDKTKWITTEKIKTTTLKDILNKHNLSHIDLIMIDTEGYDFEIIKTIPFEKIKPATIIFEHSHFIDKTKSECFHFLINHKYRLTHTVSDTIATL